MSTPREPPNIPIYAMYNDLDPVLIEARARAVRLTDAYNASYGEAAATREALLLPLLGGMEKGVAFEPTFRCEFGGNIKIGNDFYANFDCVMLDGGGIVIDDDVLFGPRVGIYTTNHALDADERARGACLAKPVRIGDRVCIGAGVHINPGVTVGSGAVIGSGSVLTHDIPENVVAAGVPCRVIRSIGAADRTGY